MVYIKKSVTEAAAGLMISQPAVTQQIRNLEAHLGKKLFKRKSKGVEPTDYGKMLNNLIAGNLESLLEVEKLIIQKTSRLKSILQVGISEHLYKTVLADKLIELGERVHVTYANRDSLIAQVEEKKLTLAITTEDVHHFDINTHVLFEQNFVLAGTPDIDFDKLKSLYKEDKAKAEKWLARQVWFAHDQNPSFIKRYWMKVFDKKRPSIVPDYVIPNEHEVLSQQARTSGLSIALDSTVQPFVDRQELVSCELEKLSLRKISMITHKTMDKEKETFLLNVLRR